MLVYNIVSKSQSRDRFFLDIDGKLYIFIYYKIYVLFYFVLYFLLSISIKYINVHFPKVLKN